MTIKIRKPTIGLNLSNNVEDGMTPTMKINNEYADAVISAGGIPLLVPQVEDENDIASIISLCDSFILIGGYDYDPGMWGENEHHPSLHLCDRRRLAFDILLIRLLLSMSIPVLGICGGHQLINIGCGGTLYQDIFSDPDFPDILPHRCPKNETAHTVKIVPGSILERVTGTWTLAVNSTHHMAVKNIGRNLTVTASSEDGCIEAIEGTDPDRFLLGVQWHPEAIADRVEQLNLFKALVEESRKNMMKRN